MRKHVAVLGRVTVAVHSSEQGRLFFSAATRSEADPLGGGGFSGGGRIIWRRDGGRRGAGDDAKSLTGHEDHPAHFAREATAVEVRQASKIAIVITSR